MLLKWRMWLWTQWPNWRSRADATIGFDRFFRVFDEAVKSRDQAKYPPYNIERTNEETYRLTLAVAGWTPTELTVTVQPGLLVVSGRKPARDGTRYLHRGIQSGSFEHRFALADDIDVRGAEMTNGLLTIELARAMPGASAPCRIAITEVASSTRAHIAVKRVAAGTHDDAVGGDARATQGPGRILRHEDMNS